MCVVDEPVVTLTGQPEIILRQGDGLNTFLIRDPSDLTVTGATLMVSYIIIQTCFPLKCSRSCCMAKYLYLACAHVNRQIVYMLATSLWLLNSVIN